MWGLNKVPFCGNRGKIGRRLGPCGTGRDVGTQAIDTLRGVGRGGTPYGCGKGRCSGGGRNISYGSEKVKSTTASD